MIQYLRRFVDNKDDSSIAAKLRRQRFAFFLTLVSELSTPLKILDVGGTEVFWEKRGFVHEAGVKVTLLNLFRTDVHYPNFVSVIGDARDMSRFDNHEFDIVFSNSVIEHLGNLADQRRMVTEIQRVGKEFFVQTPNRFFPIEPHFLFPFFQFLPTTLQVYLLRRFNIGWSSRSPDEESARKRLTAIRLLTRRELQELFPGASIHRERFFGLTKSLIAVSSFRGAHPKLT